MSVVWKFPLPHPRTVLSMPKYARVLTAGVQEDHIVIWAQVIPAQPPEHRVFNVFNTGEQLPEDVRDWVGTVQIGPIVWHIYEVAS